MKSFIPAARQLARSSAKTLAVIAIIGKSCLATCLRISSVASRPPTTGICKHSPGDFLINRLVFGKQDAQAGILRLENDVGGALALCRRLRLNFAGRQVIAQGFLETVVTERLDQYRIESRIECALGDFRFG